VAVAALATQLASMLGCTSLQNKGMQWAVQKGARSEKPDDSAGKAH
jgi:hypothetical protein